ncbi:hypothetical protein V8J82_10160 [Gymnodinialimonas sp. 2305UL16-5]|uniref:hypothetical protein n=1 Tax=Gymnodinialimonas mytili TaxID=3126503 RepID=UPI0030B6DBF2
MATFEERLARLAAEGHGDTTVPQAGFTPAPQNDHDETGHETGGGGSLALMVIAAPIAMLLGAASVLMGGIIQVVLIDGGMIDFSEIPPQLGFVAFGIALVMSFLVDRITPGRAVAPIAVTIGFVGMMFGETYLADMFPDLWFMLYEGAYLKDLMKMTGLGGL